MGFCHGEKKLQLVGITWVCSSEDDLDKVELSPEHSNHFWKTYKEIVVGEDKYPEWLVNSVQKAEKILGQATLKN